MGADGREEKDGGREGSKNSDKAETEGKVQDGGGQGGGERRKERQSFRVVLSSNHGSPSTKIFGPARILPEARIPGPPARAPGPARVCCRTRIDPTIRVGESARGRKAAVRVLVGRGRRRTRIDLFPEYGIKAARTRRRIP